MPRESFSFIMRSTPTGKLVVEVYQGRLKVGVSRKMYATVEEAVGEMKTALQHRKLADVLMRTAVPQNIN